MHCAVDEFSLLVYAVHVCVILRVRWIKPLPHKIMNKGQFRTEDVPVILRLPVKLYKTMLSRFYGPSRCIDERTVLLIRTVNDESRFCLSPSDAVLHSANVYSFIWYLHALDLEHAVGHDEWSAPTDHSIVIIAPPAAASRNNRRYRHSPIRLARAPRYENNWIYQSD